MKFEQRNETRNLKRNGERKCALGLALTLVAALACSEEADTAKGDTGLTPSEPTAESTSTSTGAPTTPTSTPPTGGSSNPTSPTNPTSPPTGQAPTNTTPTPSETAPAPTPSSTESPTPSGNEGGGGSDGSPVNASGGAGGTSPTEPAPEGTGGSTEDMPTPTTPSADGEKRSAGCGSPASIESGRHTIDAGGESREYILKLPTGYDPDRAYRFVFGLHPLGGSAQQVAGSGMGGGGYYGLDSQSNGAAIFVAPEGLPFSGSNLGWANTNGRDIALLNAILDHLGDALCIDENRVFSTGFSFGGMMSFSAGCGLEGRIRAIAPMAGNIQVSGCANGNSPVAVMGFHGDSDTVVSISGGRAGRDVFIDRNGCSSETQPASPNWCDGVGNSNQPCTCLSYQGCDEGYPVVWCEFTGGHTPAPNSAETIWNFFSQF